MNDVARMADRLLVLRGAELAMDGTPEEVFRHAQQLVDMGLDIPEVSRLFLQLKALGLSVDPVYTMEQAIAQLRTIGGKDHA